MFIHIYSICLPWVGGDAPGFVLILICKGVTQLGASLHMHMLVQALAYVLLDVWLLNHMWICMTQWVGGC